MDYKYLEFRVDKQKYQQILQSTEYKLSLSSMAERIVLKSKEAPNEATVESYFEMELFSFFREKFGLLGFEYNPIKEKTAARRHTLKGRADSALSSLVIEFKQPSTLKNNLQKKNAIEQIKEYITSLSNYAQEKYYGVVTDGVSICFLIYENNNFKQDNFFALDGESLDRLIRSIINVELFALNAKNLVSKLCNPPSNDGIAVKLAYNLYNILKKEIHPKSQMLYDEWRQLFNLAHDDISKQQAIIDRKKSLEELFNIQFGDNDEEYKALFSIQTAYAIIVKTIAFKVISRIRFRKNIINFDNLIDLDFNSLRMQLEYFENGAIFREYDITNLLEGDFFSWYVNPDQWNMELYKSINQLYIILCRFEDTPSLNSGEKSQDFFKELFQAMVPAAVRHSLGEYYTKKWLAENVINEIIDKLPNNWRALDPCCGSGTFVTVLIEKVLESEQKNTKNILTKVLSRVKGLDLNPIAVMTARVNYFINISHLLDENIPIEIPIYLGDASYVPKLEFVDGIRCLNYTINTMKEPINISVPFSMVKDPNKFSQTMSAIETDIKALDNEAIFEKLVGLCSNDDKSEKVLFNLKSLSEQLIKLEKRQWNGVWARIITNFLTTANLGKFDLVVGNPPWVDWKSLPSGYRDKIKSLCISRHLFSGDGFTGGINLNICALITNVAAQNWLADNGFLAFLMPEPLIFQQSYEGFRNLYINNVRRLYFKKFVNWNKAGKPFKPVSQKFLTYYIGFEEVDYKIGVPTIHYIKKRGVQTDDKEEIDFQGCFSSEIGLLGQCHDDKNFFTYAKDSKSLNMYANIAGSSNYIGREGIEFYPQELLVFKLSNLPSDNQLTALKNIQNDKSKYHVPERLIRLETEYLHPMIKGKNITPFHAEISDYIVSFPYNKDNPQIPIKYSILRIKAPKLAKYYQDNKSIIKAQTGYSDRIIGKEEAEFYALARVGAYSFQKYYVALRDNSNWAAAVVTDVFTEWGGIKRPLFQNHAISICEDINGNYISLNEAYYICGILNSKSVTEFMMTSSDSRSFPIRPRVRIPKFDDKDSDHIKIVKLSREAHSKYKDKNRIKEIINEIDNIYHYILNRENRRMYNVVDNKVVSTDQQESDITKDVEAPINQYTTYDSNPLMAAEGTVDS